MNSNTLFSLTSTMESGKGGRCPFEVIETLSYSKSENHSNFNVSLKKVSSIRKDEINSKSPKTYESNKSIRVFGLKKKFLELNQSLI